MMYAINIVTTVFQMGIIHNAVEGVGAPLRHGNITSLTGRKKRTTGIAVELRM